MGRDTTGVLVTNPTAVAFCPSSTQPMAQVSSLLGSLQKITGQMRYLGG